MVDLASLQNKRLSLTSKNRETHCPSVRIFKPDLWKYEVAELIHNRVESVLQKRGECNILLTGGTAAKKMYGAWSSKFDTCPLDGVSFYFGDERCVSPEHPQSNYGMAMNTLFEAGIPQGCSVHRMEAESDDLEVAANCYAAVLPESIDILLLGVGEDGHIASLFPYTAALYESKRRVLPILGPKQPRRRLTITPPVINQADSIFVLASGAGKAAVLAEAMRRPDNIDALPARLAISGVWLLDRALNSLVRYVD